MKIQIQPDNEILTIELDGLQWKTQAGAFATAFAATPKGTKRKVFIKRYSGQYIADGHGLLTGAVIRPISCTPRFLGFGEANGYRYYISEFIDSAQTFSNLTGNSRISHNKILTHRRVTNILSSLRVALEEINSRSYFHPDVCYKNIMIDPGPSRDIVYLIDLDSCIAFHSSKTASGITCDQTWWFLFIERKLRDLRFLNLTMLITLGLVLYYSMAEAELMSNHVTGNVKSILNGNPEMQRKLISVLDKNNATLLCSTFHRPSAIKEAQNLIAAWISLSQTLRSGAEPDWRKTSLFLNSLALLCRPVV